MTALPPVPDVLKFELLWLQDGIPAANIIHAGFTGGSPTSDQCLFFASSFAGAFWVDPLKADYPTTTELVGIRATDLTTDTGATGEYAVGGTGTAEDGALPAQASVLINYSIARRYRGGHPRTYLPPVALGGLATPGTWQGDIVSDFTTVWSAVQVMLSSTTDGAINLTGQVNVSYVNSGAPRVDPVVDSLTGFSVNGRVCTQRRRIRASSY